LWQSTREELAFTIRDLTDTKLLNFAVRFCSFIFIALSICVPFSFGCAADIPISKTQIELSFAPLVRQTGPAVVNIFVKTRVKDKNISPLFGDPFFRQFFGDAFSGRARRRSQQSLGSGVLVDPAGLIVTNNHVIANASQVRVVLSDRREFLAKILLTDIQTDLAILKIDIGEEKLPYIEMRDSDTVNVGDLVLAIGNPFGVGQTVTSGIVSALARTAIGITDYSFFIQTDASINPGNSGGALIAMDGKLIGINTAIFSNKGAGGGSVGIGFAVPSNMVKTVVLSAKKGKLVLPWLGASGQTINQDLAVEFGLKRPFGVVINNIFPASPADESGLKIGDVIISIGDKTVNDTDALRYRIATLPLGESTSAKIIRKRKIKTLNIELREPINDPKPDVLDVNGRNPFSGARLANLSPAFAIKEGLDDMRRGVVILGRRRGSVADNLGLRQGDILIEINGDSIRTVKDVRKSIRKSRSKWKISIRRGTKILYTEIPG
jgi:Do/DeqQ family serine protease